MLCHLCKAIPQNIRCNKQHERLQQIGLTERISLSGKSKAAWVTHYVCAICDTQWQHVDNPADASAGWSIEQTLRIPQHLPVHSQTKSAQHL